MEDLVLSIAKPKILVLICLILAVNYASQTDVIAINITSLEKLVDVTTDFNFANLLPNNEYSTDIMISWAVPDSALRNINKKEVYVYVNVKQKYDDTPILFQKGNYTYKQIYLALRCVIENGTCVNGSVLQDNFKVKWTLLDNVALNDAIVITASTTLNMTDEIYEKKSILEAEIANLENFSVMNDSENLEIKELLDGAKEDLALLRIDDANQKLESVDEIIRRSNSYLDVENAILTQDLLVPIIAVLVVLCGVYFFLRPRK
ncbi:MAG: hypothetical protein ABID61_02980 [Candidatus Micrarchaeota archaeon]